jgi:hypothetical protein
VEVKHYSDSDSKKYAILVKKSENNRKRFQKTLNLRQRASPLAHNSSVSI